VLDGGEDNVFMGKSRLNKFMESVEAVTGAIPKTEPEAPLTAPEISKYVPGPAPETMAEPWQDLLTTGAAFLQALGRTVSRGQKSGEQDLNRLFETDGKTGRSYLKIPMPDKEIIQSTLPAINSLLDALKNLVK
jgi:hypothetical protein